MKYLEERFYDIISNTPHKEQAQQCAQICEEVVLEFQDWLADNYYYRNGKFWYKWNIGWIETTNKELFQIFLNQKL